MTEPRNGPTLREYFEGLFNAHKELHADHEKSHSREHQFAETAIQTAAELAKQTKADSNEWRGSMKDREASFATKADMQSLADKIDKLDDADIRRGENERLRLISEAEDKDVERERRRRELAIWSLGAAGVAILINTVLRLAGN